MQSMLLFRCRVRLGLVVLVGVASLTVPAVVNADDCVEVGRFKVKFTAVEDGGVFSFASDINNFHGTLCSDGNAEAHGQISLFQEGGVISDFPLPPDMVLEFKASTGTWAQVGTNVETITNVVPRGAFEEFLLENFGSEGLIGWSSTLRIPILDNAFLDINNDGIVDVRVDVDLDV